MTPIFVSGQASQPASLSHLPPLALLAKMVLNDQHGLRFARRENRPARWIVPALLPDAFRLL